MRLLGILSAVAALLGSATAQADELTSCGVTDPDYALAVQQIDEMGYRERPILAFFEISGTLMFRDVVDGINTSSVESALIGGLFTMGRVMPLLRVGNKPPVWEGDRIAGKSRLETVEDTMEMLAMMRSFAHRIHPPQALKDVSQTLSACPSLGSKSRKTLREALEDTAYTPVQQRLYDGDGTNSDILASINETHSGYKKSVRATSEVAARILSFVGLSSKDLCKRLNFARGGEEWDAVEERRTRCALVLVGGAPEIEAIFALADLSQSYYPILKVAGAADARGTLRIEDRRFEATLVEILQLQQTHSVNSALRVLALSPDKQGQAIRVALDELAALDEGFSMSPERMAAGFSASDRQGRSDAAKREREIEKQMETIQDAVIKIWLKEKNRFDKLVSLTATPDDIKGALRPDEALVVLDLSAYVPTTVAMTQNGVYAANAAVSPNQVTAAKAAVNRAIQDYVAGNGGRFPTDDAYTLYQGTLGAIEGILPGKRRLYVLANSDAQNIPFDALASHPATATHPARYLIEDLEVVMIPSISAFVDQRRAGVKVPALETFAAFSDPAFSAAAPALPTSALMSLGANFGDVATPCALPRVRATERIAQSLEKRFTAIPDGDRRGATATEGAVYSLAAGGQMSSADVLAFNTHGLLADQVPTALGGDPALALLPTDGSCATPAATPAAEAADGFLTSAEITRMQLDVPLVLLTACNTVSAGSIDAKAPLTGLARAFFAAGAKTVVVSNWDALVADETALIPGPTELFVDALFDPAGDQMSFSARMRAAKMKVRETYDHPAAWAVFSLVGTGD